MITLADIAQCLWFGRWIKPYPVVKSGNDPMTQSIRLKVAYFTCQIKTFCYICQNNHIMKGWIHSCTCMWNMELIKYTQGAVHHICLIILIPMKSLDRFSTFWWSIGQSVWRLFMNIYKVVLLSSFVSKPTTAIHWTFPDTSKNTLLSSKARN